jgi:diguanylate cyclase (GGDEF)-like protein/PAS domain S-box-containing protein
MQQEALLDLVRSGVVSRDLDICLRTLTETAARVLKVTRVSVWEMVVGADALTLRDLYESPAARHSKGTVITATDYPEYFAALAESRTIAANNTFSDPRTMCLVESYMKPRSIVSMLDAAVWIGGQTRGVVCVESVGTHRDWQPDEELFVASIADMVALAVENERRRSVEADLQSSRERLSRAFRLSPDGMLIVRLADNVILDINESFARGSGYSAAELVGNTTAAFNLWVDAAQRDEWLTILKRDGSVRNFDARAYTRSGEVRELQISSELVEIGGQRCIISVSRDVTEKKRQENLVVEIAQGIAAATGETFFRSLVQRLAVALDADLAIVGEIAADSQDHINTVAVWAEGQLADNFQYPLAGSPCQKIVGATVCCYPDHVADQFPDDKPLREKQIEAYVGAPLTSATGEKLGLISVMFKKALPNSALAESLLRIFATRATSELERRKQLVALEYRASHDLLTGLANRSAIVQRIDATDSHGGTLMLMDLDRFKEVNDTLGHAVGDELLIHLARRLLVEVPCRANGLVGRLGGDEFGIWVERATDGDEASLLARRVLEVVTRPFELRGYRLEIGASIGIAMKPEHGETAAELMRCADVAMYNAKRKGGGHRIYAAAEDQYSGDRLTLMGELSGAIRAGQLEPWFQPRVNLSTGRLAGFEALVRWLHPERGLLGPASFIPLAELSDTIRPLTLAVLDAALAEQQAKWPDVQLAVNLSARHLMDEDCPRQVEALLQKYGTNPALLEFEITESALIVDPDRAAHTLSRIHAMGVSLAIDDFGTGYSSLSFLRRLPLNALKIDVSFVRNMLSSDQDAAIVHSTIGLAHTLGLSVVAEGIENAETRDRLASLGCDEGQGFWFAEPMSREMTSRWIAAQMATLAAPLAQSTLAA